MEIKQNFYGDCEYCVICGEPIPEGTQVCVNCQTKYLEQND